MSYHKDIIEELQSELKLLMDCINHLCKRVVLLEKKIKVDNKSE